jgi:hypothetical protein
MRFAKLVLGLAGMAAMALAADPFVGTWKLNTSMSKYKTGAPSKEQTVTITEKGADLDVHIKGTSADGKPYSAHYTKPAKRGTAKVMESPNYDGVMVKRPSETEREISYTKGGKVVYTATPRVSTDGKSMRVAVKGTDAAGKPVGGTAVFERQ